MRKSILTLTAACLACVLVSCTSRSTGTFQGYIEGEFIYVASPLSGVLTNLAVSRGAEVQAGHLLFVLEHGLESAEWLEAKGRLGQARARLENLNKGRRPPEIASLQAQLERAQASLRLSQLELERRAKLLEGKAISAEEFDVSQSRRDADHASVSALSADLETARLGAREDEVRAAEAEIQAWTATVTKAEWAVTQKTQFAPTNAWVHDNLYREGEFVAAGRPVVSLLPPANLKVRFFVPQPRLADFKTGTTVLVQIDGAAAPLRATVNYISTQAEFTPPVLYSKENRAKLVFMVEAAFAAGDAIQLRPGQPVDVRQAP